MPVVALLISMVSLQFGASFATRLFATVGAQGATALRLALAAAMLAAAFRPFRAPIARVAWGPLLGYGASLGVMNLLFYLSLRSVPLGIAVALEFLGPLAVTLRHIRRRLDAAWIALALAGLGVLLPIGRRVHAVDPAGAACALGAGLCWALYMTFGPRVGAALGTRAAALGTLVAAILVVPIGVAHAGMLLVSPAVLWRGLVVALFSSALPYTLEMIALTRLPIRVFGTLTSLEPAVGALVGMAVLGQSLSALQCAAIAAISAAAMGSVASG